MSSSTSSAFLLNLLAHHNSYLESFVKCHDEIMYGDDGPLPYVIRQFIAFKASIRTRTWCLVEAARNEFLENGGNEMWLATVIKKRPHQQRNNKKSKVGRKKREETKKLSDDDGFEELRDEDDVEEIQTDTQQQLPLKYQAIEKLNRILAHRPWLLLINNGDSNDPEDDVFEYLSSAGWSISEMAQMLVIFAHYHALSSFVHASEACGVVDAGEPDNHNAVVVENTIAREEANVAEPYLPRAEDEDEVDSRHFSRATSGSPPPLSSSLLVDSLLATMRTLTENEKTDDNIYDPVELVKRFETVLGEEEESLTTPMNKSSPVDQFPVTAACEKGKAKKMTVSNENKTAVDIKPRPTGNGSDKEEEDGFHYEDFVKSQLNLKQHTFRVQDYSWSEHCIPVLTRLYSENITNLLDMRFNTSKSMTYLTMGPCHNVDTTKFRTAVWNYIHCLYGIRHDDYDYGEINQLLQRRFKGYLKDNTVWPEMNDGRREPSIGDDKNEPIMAGFMSSEKVHVNIMLMDAKLQAELLYSLRSLSRRMFFR